jgi:hypothetical protein
MAATNAQRKQAYREKIESMGMVQESVYVHNDDKQALRIYAAQLRKARGCPLPADSKILDAARIQEDVSVQPESIDPTIAQTKIDRVAAVVESFDAMKKTETSPRWEKAMQFIKAIKDALKNE